LKTKKFLPIAAKLMPDGGGWAAESRRGKKHPTNCGKIFFGGRNFFSLAFADYLPETDRITSK
jgi:hypothetical protein